MKNFLYKATELLLIVIVGVIITLLSLRIPLDGPQVSGTINCGFPSGLPLSFIGTWKYLSGPPQPLCAVGFDPVSLILDVAFWATVFYLILYFVKKLAKRFQITLDKGRIIAVLVILVFLFLLILLQIQNVYAQSLIKFDLENLINQNPLFTKAYDIIRVQSAWARIINSSTSLASTIIGVLIQVSIRAIKSSTHRQLILVRLVVPYCLILNR